MSGRIKLFLLMLLLPLTACKAPGPLVVLPPSTLYQGSCAGTLLEARPAPFTNGELLTYSIDLKAALRGCQADRGALQGWADTLGQKHE